MYIGHRHKRIITISDREFTASKLAVLKLPPELINVPKDKLLRDYEVWHGSVVPRNINKDLKSLKVAFVGVYNIKCGISTYAEALFPEIAKYVGGYRIFAEISDNTTNDVNIVRCWTRGTSLDKLVDQINEYDPDVVIVQHEYGIFPIARHWLSFISEMQKFKTIVTMHSVYKHKDKTICEAVVKNIVVHTEIAKKILTEEKKVPGRVSVIPHFCVPCTNNEKYWNLYQSQHTIVQFGFGFRYKGWEQAIEVVDKLRGEFPDIFFTGLFSESDYSQSQHDQYYYELYDLIRDKGISKYIAIIRGYQSDETLNAFLRTNQIAMFPYIDNGEHTVYGCSGAARFTMRTGIPVITSNAPLFDDLEDVCPRPKNLEELCDEVRKLFRSKEAMKIQQEKQKLFLLKNSLENVTKMYLELISTV